MSGASGLPDSFLFPEILETSAPNERQTQISQGAKQHENQGTGTVNQKRLRSAVWEDFDKYIDEDGNEKAKCKGCWRLFNGSSKKGTTHLKNHSTSCKGKTNGDDGQLNHLRTTTVLSKFPQKQFYRICVRIQEILTGVDEFTLSYVDDNWELKIISLGEISRESERLSLMENLRNVLFERGIGNHLPYLVYSPKYNSYMYTGRNYFLNFDSSIPLFFNIFSIFSDITRRVNSHVNNLLSVIKENDNYRKVIDVAISFLDKQVNVDEFIEGKWLYNVSTPVDYITYTCQLNNFLHLRTTFGELSRNHVKFKNLSREDWGLIRAFCLSSEDEDFLMKYCKDNQATNTHFFLSISMWKSIIKSRKITKGDINKLDPIPASFINVNGWSELNRTLAMAALLDPRFGMKEVKNWYEKILDDGWEKEFKKFVDYVTGVYKEYEGCVNSSLLQEESSSSIPLQVEHPLKESNSAQIPSSELNRYLQISQSTSWDDINVLKWWRDHAQYFPTLARICRHLLSIQISPYIFLNDLNSIL